jgi:hypothetical protein
MVGPFSVGWHIRLERCLSYPGAIFSMRDLRAGL